MNNSIAKSAGLPERIGRYEVRRRLGKGGMGTVYLAHDPRLHRLVAIKLLNDHFRDDEELLQRFMREARAAGGLRHSNIVVVFDVEEDNGRPFIAMEYVEGETLDHVIRKAPPLPLAARIALMEDLCAALAHAHAAGIVHRDIKPTNIMLDTAGVLKILDFGIARVANSGLTREGVIMGSVHYISPEQVVGPQIDHRSDIFAAGAVLYELIAIERAFQAESDTGVLRAILYEGAVPLARRIPDVDPELAEIVRRALEREPAMRYQDAAAMRQDLARVRERLTQPAVPPAPTLIRLAPPIAAPRPRRYWVAGVAAAAVAFVAMASVATVTVVRSASSKLPEPPRVTLPTSVPAPVMNGLDPTLVAPLPPVPRQQAPITSSAPAQPGAQAADEVATLRSRAQEAYAADRGRDALVLLQQALRLRPGDAESLALMESMLVDAERAANEARSEAERQDARRRASLLFGEADSLLRSANVERRAGRYERALPGYWDARDRFAAAARNSLQAIAAEPVATTPPDSAGTGAPPPVPRRDAAVVRVDDTAAIRQILRDYEDAWNRRDLDALRRIHELDARGVAAVQRNFDNARVLTTTVGSPSIELDGSGRAAVVRVTIQRHFTPHQGSEQSRSESLVLRLEKRGTSWVIVEMSSARRRR